jgi:hypothetical protein
MDTLSLTLNITAFNQQTLYLGFIWFPVQTVITKSSIFWDMTPCNPLKVNLLFRWTCLLHFQGRRISHEKTHMKHIASRAHSTSLKMEATCSSETSADFQQTTGRYIPEDRILHSHRCESFKSYKEYLFP